MQIAFLNYAYHKKRVSICSIISLNETYYTGPKTMILTNLCMSMCRKSSEGVSRTLRGRSPLSHSPANRYKWRANTSYIAADVLVTWCQMKDARTYSKPAVPRKSLCKINWSELHQAVRHQPFQDASQVICNTTQVLVYQLASMNFLTLLSKNCLLRYSRASNIYGISYHDGMSYHWRWRRTIGTASLVSTGLYKWVQTRNIVKVFYSSSVCQNNAWTCNGLHL